MSAYNAVVLAFVALALVALWVHFLAGVVKSVREARRLRSYDFPTYPDLPASPRGRPSSQGRG